MLLALVIVSAMLLKKIPALALAALIAVTMSSCAEAATVLLPEIVTPVPRVSVDPCAELSGVLDGLYATEEPAWERPDEFSMVVLEMAESTGEFEDFAPFREAAEDVAFYAVDFDDPYLSDEEIDAYYDSVDGFVYELEGVFELCGWNG